MAQNGQHAKIHYQLKKDRPPAFPSKSIAIIRTIIFPPIQAVRDAIVLRGDP